MIAACVFAAKIGTMIICSPSLVAIWGRSRQQGTQPEHSLRPFALQWTDGKAKARREWCHAVLSCVSGDTRRHKHVHGGKVRAADRYIDMCSLETQNSKQEHKKKQWSDTSYMTKRVLFELLELTVFGRPGLEELPDLWRFDRQDKVSWEKWRRANIALSCLESWPPKKISFQQLETCDASSVPDIL